MSATAPSMTKNSRYLSYNQAYLHTSLTNKIVP
ncbi:unnamed protein product [Mycetohabitans rhizoxinica HKI 454]|uniref:Uncharacterized protein n=1 Tax=Mycetohabitans rhizoxinica (strain DSM 19002 / CIP 109453 / HKI 454) TaxID=882378 RepID=E5APX1_MYCRK|nr:unnamed protein product [Mycetohabitans rhizoxinica HKI 454]